MDLAKPDRGSGAAQAALPDMFHRQLCTCFHFREFIACRLDGLANLEIRRFGENRQESIRV